jgi:hypothetical protein
MDIEWDVTILKYDLFDKLIVVKSIETGIFHQQRHRIKRGFDQQPTGFLWIFTEEHAANHQRDHDSSLEIWDLMGSSVTQCGFTSQRMGMEYNLVGGLEHGLYEYPFSWEWKNQTN